MTKRASITVCVPTRNRAASLRHTLLAMQGQTEPYDELIVGDDASDDTTRQTVEQFQDGRTIYVRNRRNLGLYQNWNELIDRASGAYVCIYHDHDLYLPTILQKSRQILDEHPDVVFVHTAILLVDATGSLAGADVRPFPPLIPGSKMCRLLAGNWHSPIMAATVMARREAYRAVGPYRPDLYGLGCDKHMWFQLAKTGNIGYVAAPQALIRTREKGAGTAVFSWSNEWATLRLREAQIAEMFESDNQKLQTAMRSHARETSHRMLPLAIRALLLERPEVWAQDEARVISTLTPGARALYYTAKWSSPVRTCLKGLVLPLHYRRLAIKDRKARITAQAIAEQLAIPIPLPSGTSNGTSVSSGHNR